MFGFIKRIIKIVLMVRLITAMLRRFTEMSR